MRPASRRRLVITVCPREPGTVRLPLADGGPARRLDARAVARHLEALAAERGVGTLVEVRLACAGGCGAAGPNVSVALHPIPSPGEPADQVAVGWKTYVYSLATLPSLARIIEDNLHLPRPRRRR